MLGDNHWIRVSGDTVLANGDGGLRAWSLDGKPRWSFTRDGMRAEVPVVDAARGTVCALLISDRMINKWGRGPMAWGRWNTSTEVASLVALDLKTGAVRWENTDVASRPLDFTLFNRKEPARLAFGQLLVSGDHVIAFNPCAIFGGLENASFIASIDATSGRTVHFDPRSMIRASPHGRVESRIALCALARDGIVYVMSGFDIQSYDPRTGAITEVLQVPWNARCHKPIATVSHFLLGQTAFIGKDFGLSCRSADSLTGSV
jgi:hypothetical protein